MKTLQKQIAFQCILLALFTFNGRLAKAQFEQKLTINGAFVYVVPEITSSDPLFTTGFGVDGGVQYNLNRRFSAFGSARFYYMYSDDGESYYDNLAFGGGLKLNILPNKLINPYVYAECNVNFSWIEEFIYIPNGDSFYDNDFGTSIGGLGGLGFDFRFGENFNMFLQGGPYYTAWDGFVNAYIQAGVRINLLKSKSI